MNRNLKLVINNIYSDKNSQNFFEKNELKIILNLYAKMVSEGSWKDYGLSYQVNKSVLVFLKMLQKMLYTRYAKILNQRTKI